MKYKRLTVAFVRYFPVIMIILQTGHIAIHFFFGVTLRIAEYLVGISICPTIILLMISWNFGYCWLHRAMTIYSLILCLAIDYCREGGLQPVWAYEVVGMSISAILLSMLVFNWKKYKLCNPQMPCHYKN